MKIASKLLQKEKLKFYFLAAILLSLLMILLLTFKKHQRTGYLIQQNNSFGLLFKLGELKDNLLNVESLIGRYSITTEDSVKYVIEKKEKAIVQQLQELRSNSILGRNALFVKLIDGFIGKHKISSYDSILSVHPAESRFLEMFKREHDELSGLVQMVDSFIKIETTRVVELREKMSTIFTTLTYVVTVCLAVLILFMLLIYKFIYDLLERFTNNKRQLIKAQLDLQNIIDELPIGLIIVHKAENRFHANYAAVKLLNGQIEQDGYLFTKGAPVQNTLNENLLDDLLILSAFEGHKRIGNDEKVISFDGVSKPIRVSSIPLYNQRNEIESVLCVFDDITDIKSAEKELRTAKKLVEEALMLRDTFLANMSHEIRTPMNAILGFTELLSKKELGEPANEYIKNIHIAGENLLRLINDILDFSKLQANMMVFEEQPVDLKEIVVNVCSLYDRKAEENGTTLSYRFDETIPHVITDPVRISQVLTNIIGNAIKFTSRGSINIYAKVLSRESENVKLRFDVVDTGIGIPKKKLVSIFKRFEQVGNSNVHGGTGLGLSISKHIVQNLGGEIFATSELGVGSSFTFILNFKIYVEDKARVKAKERAELDFSELKNLNILLVEDNDFNIKLAEGIFNDYDIKFDVALNGKTALEKIRHSNFDIILMDIELPDTNGYKLTEIVRQQFKSDVKIIALTAHALAGEKDKCIASGMNDYVSKPINTQVLFRKMYNLTLRNGDDQVFEEEPETHSIVSKIVETDISTDKNELIDLNYLYDISNGDRGFQKEMITLLISRISTQSAELQEAIESGHPKTVKMLAHNLKATVKTVFKKGTEEFLEQIEQSASNNNINEETSEKYEAGLVTLKVGLEELERIINEKYIDI